MFRLVDLEIELLRNAVLWNPNDCPRNKATKVTKSPCRVILTIAALVLVAQLETFSF